MFHGLGYNIKCCCIFGVQTLNSLIEGYADSARRNIFLYILISCRMKWNFTYHGVSRITIIGVKVLKEKGLAKRHFTHFTIITYNANVRYKFITSVRWEVLNTSSTPLERPQQKARNTWKDQKFFFYE